MNVYGSLKDSRIVNYVFKAIHNKQKKIIINDIDAKVDLVHIEDVVGALNSILISKLIDGKFPNYIQVIPKNNQKKLEIDLRTDTTDKKYVVGLAVRNDSFTGHAFVILYQQDQQDAEKKDFKVYGYYPKRIANIPIPIGVVKNDSNCLKHIPPNGDMYFIVDEAAFIENMEVFWASIFPTISTGGEINLPYCANAASAFS